VVGKLSLYTTFDADKSPAAGMGRVAFDTCNFTVLDVYENTALGMTTLATGSHNSFHSRSPTNCDNSKISPSYLYFRLR
jgi:hypothetical protein